jgi:tRNA(Ile)-lysidine synthase TilS/MesJ
VVGIWRLGLTMRCKQQLKQQFAKLQNNTTTSLVDYDIQRAQQIQSRLQQISNLVVVDAHHSSNKLPVFSFLIKCGPRFLHYNYVSSVLNDVFGVQSRGGCQCAGPYAQRLLGLSGQQNAAVEEWLVHSKDELLRPGITRLSLPTLGTTQEQEDYVVQAIEWVAQHGWKLLHVYRCNHRAGEWRHKSRPGTPLGKHERKWLSHYQALQQQQQQQQNVTVADPQLPPSLSQAMDNANKLLQIVLQDQSSISQALKMTHEQEDASSLRWYVYPKEVASYIQQGLDEVPGTQDRDNLLGAMRPLAWYPISEEEETEASNTAPTPQVANSSHLRFRDGEHKGAAPLEEIRQGHEDEELSDACQIYNDTTDSWENIGAFFRSHGSETAVSTTARETQEEEKKQDDAIVEEEMNGLLRFRDGENHSGEASWEEIEVGYDDGELSKQCQIFDPTEEAWETIDAVLQKKRAPTIDDGAEDDDDVDVPVVTSVMAKPPVYDLPVVEKNEKKKPQRDSTAWGQGSMVSFKAASEPNVDTSAPQSSKRKKSKHIKPPAKLMRSVTQAMIQWDMLEEGDRLLLGLSGGKDSLSLLHVLLEFQKKLPINFEIEVCTIDPMTPSFDPSPMISYVESLGLKYHYIRDDIVDRATNAGTDGKMVSSLCAFCARMKRGNLYSCARKNNCNKLVLAQHLDDLAESFMMSVMHNGFLRTMKANYKINAGDLSVIRPLVYCRESLMTDFAKSANLPIINENCPACFEEPKERARIKKLLSKEETLYANFYDNIKRAMLPLMHDDSTAILRSYTEEALAKSRKENHVKKRPIGSKSRNGEKSNPDENFKNGDGCETVQESGASLTQQQGFELEEEPRKTKTSLADASEEELVRELAHRRAERFRTAGAMKRSDDEDPTGQVCTLNGGNGSIPCRELME